MKLFNDADITYQQLFHVTEHSFYKVFARPLSDISSKADIDFVNAERQLRYGPQYILPAEYSYEYNLICNDPHRRIITIDFGDDIAIVVLKRVQMFQNVYTRIEGIPISRSRNKIKWDIRSVKKFQVTISIPIFHRILQKLIATNGSTKRASNAWKRCLV